MTVFLCTKHGKIMHQEVDQSKAHKYPGTPEGFNQCIQDFLKMSDSEIVDSFDEVAGKYDECIECGRKFWKSDINFYLTRGDLNSDRRYRELTCEPCFLKRHSFIEQQFLKACRESFVKNDCKN